LLLTLSLLLPPPALGRLLGDRLRPACPLATSRRLAAIEPRPAAAGPGRAATWPALAAEGKPMVAPEGRAVGRSATNRLWMRTRAMETPRDAPKKDSAPREIRHTMATVKDQLRLFWQMSVPYFKEDRGAKVMLATVIALTLLQSGVSVMFSFVSKDFWSALNTRDVSGFANVVSRFGVALVSGVPVAVFYRYQRERLSLKWREWMTERVLTLYTANRAFYSIENLSTQDASSSKGGASTSLDNPDQRIAEDVRSFCTVSLAFFITVLTSCIDLVSFSAILWSIYPQLFVAILVYASLGTVVTAYLGKKLAALNFEQLQREADFRYSLMRLRENAESIAFYGGEEQERAESQERLNSLIDNVQELIRQQRNLEFFTTSYRYLIQILPGTIVAPLYFKGAVELGSVSQSYSAFNHILGDLSLIVNQFEDLARFGAGIDRLGEFIEALRAEDTDAARTALAKMRAAAPSEGDTQRAADMAAGRKGLLELPRAFNQTLQMGLNEALPLPRVPEIGSPIPMGNTNALMGREGTPSSPSSSSSSEDGRIETAKKALRDIEDSLGIDSSAGPTIILNNFDSTGLTGVPLLRVRNVSLLTPDRRRSLVQQLSLQLEPGGSMLIVGDSGTGKSSLLRAIAGLWRAGSGTIDRPLQEEVFFLPQRPYCTLGSLRDQLKYPGMERWRKSRSARLQKKYETEDDELLDILSAVKLGGLAKKWANEGRADGDHDDDVDLKSALDVKKDWSSILSLGEQQRLAFGRLLYACPSLAILDEATSALDLDTEREMYRVVKERIPGLSVVSVGHRPSLKAFHDTMLRLKQDGQWEVKAVETQEHEQSVLEQM